MAGKALIIVPSQGDDAGSFYLVARDLQSEVYANNATIVRTTVAKSGEDLSVSFKKCSDEDFAWGESGDLSTVITISHAYYCDGPNLASGDGGYQPWGSENMQCEVLSEQAKAFWTKVGVALKPEGKIILLGCYMGYKAYAQHVATTAQRNTYASTYSFAAGDSPHATQYVREIEGGTVTWPMKEFLP